jgi:SHS family lactate transporter-like MFS transporter
MCGLENDGARLLAWARVWVRNQANQKSRHAEMKVPLAVIFRRGMLWNTFTACCWMAAGLTVYYSDFGLFATYPAKDLHMSQSAVGCPLVFTNAATFLASFLWGGLSGKIGRRWAMIIPAIPGFSITPVYLLTTDYLTVVIAITLQGACAGAIWRSCQPNRGAARNGMAGHFSVTLSIFG